METPSPTRKDQRREAILAVAGDVFSEEGYQAASMSTIAARLGGSKGTLYNYFQSKEALFEAYIRNSCDRVAANVPDPSDDIPVAEGLARVGQRFLDLVLSDWAVRTFQVVVAEVRRAPEVARMFFEAGPMIGHDRLTLFLEAAVRRGEIAVDDCGEAAWQFLGLCRIHHLEVVLGVKPKPSSAEITRQVKWAVEMFMLRYGVQSTAAPA